MNEQARYWWREARESLETARVLLAGARYLEAGFFCHLAMEKALKAVLAARTGKIPPKTHNLVMLADKAGLRLPPRQRRILAAVAPFQIVGRYPDDRDEILARTPPAAFAELLGQVEEGMAWLEQHLK